jgi:DNA-binding transcriptional MerR regulator
LTDNPPATPSAKAGDAFRTIGELADELGLPQHILRYWETRFPQLRPLQRAGKRRYYRPTDVALVRRIDRLLNHEGYTIRGVQKLLDAKTPDDAPAPPPQVPSAAPSPGPAVQSTSPVPSAPIAELRSIRDRLAAALDADAA